MIDEFLVHLFHEGNNLEAYKLFGAHRINEDQVRFCVYAPNARGVQVIGEFNNWGEQAIYLERVHDSGIYAAEVANVAEGAMYKYRIETEHGEWIDKADPYAVYSELRPGTASRVCDLDGYRWSDTRWMNQRNKNFEGKLNIYEMHFGSWKMKKEFTEEEDGIFYGYDELAETLIPYIKKMGYTHIELMPLLEHPFDGSWGYQSTGYFSITSRYGTPQQFMNFVNTCHRHNIGIIMDFVPTHFVKDAHGLSMFDGGYVFEYPDENWRYTEWDSVYFDIGRPQVQSFLMSSVHLLLEYYHIDGVRFDAVSHLIHRKGDKSQGLNDGGIAFAQHMNGTLNERFPSCMLIAEDSSDYPQVTKHPSVGGLGFDYKWDLGWMNDTLKYLALDPIYRQNYHHLITFSMAYFYQENFILPLSHDEVVHSKGTILDKMWGNAEQQLAQLKVLYTYMMLHPGKKLNFMGNELAEYKEWDEKKALGWNILDYPNHESFHQFVRKIHTLYKQQPSMHQYDYYPEGFTWLVVDDTMQSVFAFQRSAPDGSSLIVVLNFTGNTHDGYQIPVTEPGTYKELLNSDNKRFAGSNFRNTKKIKSMEGMCWSYNNYIPIKIAPFSASLFVLDDK